MKWMMLILILFLSGCNMKRWCQERFPPVEKTDTITWIDTVLKDVPVFFPMPKDTVRLMDTIRVKDAPETLVDTLKTDFAVSLCGWRNGIMLHDLFHRDVIIKDTVEVKLFNSTQLITLDRIHEVKYVPRIYKWSLWIVITLIALIMGRIFVLPKIVPWILKL